jgi:hypothetical protein
VTSSPTWINDYRRHATRHAATDYADQTSVREGNQAADSMLKIAREVAQSGEDAIRRFASLLDDPATSGWAAHHLLECMDAEPALVERALAVIEARSRGDGVAALGERMWLQAWHAKATAEANARKPNTR